MELIETSLSPVQRRAGAALVRWADLVDQQRRRGQAVRVLAIGDAVVLRVDGHAFHLGRVLSHLGSGTEGAYVVTLGSPLGRARALRLVGLTDLDLHAGDDPAGPRVIDVEERVVASQASARVRGRIPAQRPPQVSLYL